MLSTAVLVALGATPSSIVLVHSASNAATCPDEAWLRESVTARLGRSPFVTDGAPLFTTSVSCSSRGCVADLRFLEAGQQRVRTLNGTANECRELMESLSLALALAIDPLLLTRPKPPPPVEAPPPVEVPPPPKVAPPPPAPAPVPPPPVRLDLQAAVGGAGIFGPAPALGGGVLVGAGLGLDRFQLWLEGQLDLPQATTVGEGAVTSQILVGRVAPCLRFSSFAACAVVSVGALQVDGALPGGKRSSSPLVLAGGRVSWSHFFLEWLGVRLHADVQAVITRTTVLAFGQPVWVTTPLAAGLGAGIVFRF